MAESPTATPKVPQREACSWCRGWGVVQERPDSTPDECRKCGGSGEVEARDARGRFLPWVVPSDG